MTRDEPVVVCLSYPPAWDPRCPEDVARDKRALTAVHGSVRLVHCRLDRAGRGPAARLARRADVAVALSLPADVTRIAPRLRWVQSMGAGANGVLTPDLVRAGIRVTTASGVNAGAVAEFAIARVLAHAKRFDELAALQAERRWSPCHGTQLAGRTLGVLGLGAIGTEVARLAQAFGMRVLAVRRHTDLAAPHVERVFGPHDLHAVLAQCDAVVAALPDTAETTDLMGEEAFAAMRPGAFFCNVGRGSCVVEEALVAALRSGHLGAAAIDVARHEPPDPADPLWSAPHLAVSPHAATAADAHFTGLYRLLQDNLARFLSGRPLVNEVDPALGY
ncbi:D-2-hydroxyacid dehydrogenase [Streptomyces bambusae]|uniref:D-2-hydroxyacid dehydrogenase n=1 Tax=Streptomyces bambusae TaxID=1550616 RepID=UPI001CFC71BB|nr:D-2-hydroxyacid dehydrogenase [Streptomyces bambusae]MCB5164711.1 D-2-hydroxyacid dehydrogenase [Streptomyces bambusae]